MSQPVFRHRASPGTRPTLREPGRALRICQILGFPTRARGRIEPALWCPSAKTGTTVEHVLALHFDTKHRLIGVHVVSVGTLDASLVHPREVFKAAYLSNASALILAHNHPSGDPTPSGEDRALSDRLRQAGELLGVTLLDFVIVTDPAEGFRYYSFKESGVLT